MDMTTIAAPPESVWLLLAELANCGQNIDLLLDSQQLAQTIATCLRTHLSCTWGYVALDASPDAAAASWGLDSAQQQALALHNGCPPAVPAGTLGMQLAYEQAPAGSVLLGMTPVEEQALQSSGFMAALQRQLELLLTLQRREATHQSMHAHVDAASLLSLDLVGQLDLREVLRTLIMRALTLTNSHSAAIYMISEHENLDLVVSHGLSGRYHNLRLAPGEDVAGQVVAQRTTLVIQQYGDFEHHSSQLARETWHSAIGVPLRTQDELIGVLVLLRSVMQPVFNPVDQQLIEAFAKPAALIVRNAQLFAQQQQRSRELFVLYENSQIIGATLHIESMLTRVAENIMLAMNADRCVLHLIDPSDRSMLYEAASYSADSSDVANEVRYSVHAYSVIAGLLRSGETLTLEEPTHARRNAHDVLKHLGFRSALLLALKNRDRTVGFLGIGFISRDHHFSRTELNLAQTLANQVAAGIVNAQLYVVEQQRADELTKLQQMSSQLGTNLDLDETLSAIYDGTRSLVSFTGLQINLYNTADQTLNLAVAYGLSDIPSQYQLSDGLCGWVARYRKALRLNGAEHPPARPHVMQFADDTPVRSYLGLPLIIDDKLIGTLELFSHQPQQFSSFDEHLLMIAASSAARALLNVQRYEQADEHLHSRLKQLTALQHVSRQLAATLSLDVILGFALEEALRATPATQGYIALQRGGEDDLKVEDAKTAQVRGYIALRASNQPRQFEVLAANGYSDEQHDRIVGSVLDHDQTVAAQALRSNEAELVDELITDDRLHGIGAEAASAMAMPIFYEDHVVGVLNLHSTTAHAFDHDSIEFARALTDQVALAIGNAQRYDEQRRQRELLIKRASMLNEVFGIGQALRADRSLEEVLEQIAFSVIDTTDFRSVAFCLPSNEQLTAFTVITGAGMPLNDIERMRYTPLSFTLLERFFDSAFQLGRCFFVPVEAVQIIAQETHTEPIRLFIPVDGGTEPQIDNLLLVPLYSTRAHLVGIMIVNIPADRPQPTRRAVEPLEIFGDQAAIAIENANLLLEARAQTEQMTALYHVGTAATSTLDLDELLEGVYSEIVAYLDVPSFFFVASYEHQKEELLFELFKEGNADHPKRHKTVMPKGGWTGHVIDTGAMLYIRDSANEMLPTQPIILGKMVRSWIGIPLLSHNEIIGVLSVQHYEPNAFRERDVQFLSALANQLAVALQNARLFREREQRIVELNAINNLSRISNSTLDLRQMLHQIYDGIKASLSVDAGFIHIYRVAQNDINFGLEIDEDIRSFIEHTSGPASGSLTDHVMKTGQPLLFRDLRAEAEAVELQPLGFGDKARQSASWLGVPLIGRDGEIIGVLSVQSYTPNLYDERDITFMTTVASQVALGVQNAALFDSTQRRVSELSALLEAARVLGSTLNPSEVLDMLMNVVRRQFDIDSVALWTISGDNVLSPAAMLSVAPEEMVTLRVPLDSGLIGQVAATGEPLVVEDVAEGDASLYPSFNQEHHLVSFMGVPVSYHNQTVGVLSVMASERRSFSRDEVMLLSGVAAQAAIALENARLFEERERRLREVIAMKDIGNAVTSTLDSKEALERLHAELGKVLDISTSSIDIYDDENGCILSPIAFDQGDPIDCPPLPIEQSGLTNWVITHQKPVLLGTIREAEQLVPDLGPRVGNVDDVEQSFLLVPIMSGEQVLGVVNIQSYEPHAFSQDDLRFVTTVASQAAQAIRNAQLYEEVRTAKEALEDRVRERTQQLSEEKERLQAVYDITHELTASLDLNEILEKTLALASKAVGARRGSIMLRDTPDDTLVCQAVLDGSGMVKVANIPISFEGGPSLANWVLRHREAVRIGDVRSDPRWIREEGRAEDVRSVVAVPLIGQDDPLGVLILRSPEIDFFSDSQVRLLMTIAGEIAIVINNAKLHSFITDIATSRAELLNQQREENTKTQAILQSLGEGVIVLNEHNQIVLFNRAAEEMLDIAAGAIIGQPLTAIGSYGNTDAVQQRSWKILSGFQQGLDEITVHGKNHTRIVELPAPDQSIALNFAAVIGPSNITYGSVVVLRDITREIEADRAKRDFVSSVSHELRTPLTAIKGFVDLLNAGTAGALNEGQAAFLSVVKNNTRRLMELIDDMLEIGRIDANKIELNFDSVNVPDIITDVLQTLQAEIARKAQSVHIDIAPDLPPIEADERRLTQVVLNLVSNAVKYTYPEGSISIRSSLNPAGMLEVDVEDTGVGVSPEQQKNLFRRFYRADNPLRDEVVGTGLGLSIAKSLVELHSGEMWVQSEVGKGSIFSFILPVQQPEQADDE